MKMVLEFNLPDDDEKLMNFAEEIIHFFGDDEIVTIYPHSVWPNGIEKDEDNSRT